MIYKPQITHTYDGYQYLVAELTHLLLCNKELEIHISHLECGDIGPYINHVFAPVYHKATVNPSRGFNRKVIFYAKKKDSHKATVINQYLNGLFIPHFRKAHRIIIDR